MHVTVIIAMKETKENFVACIHSFLQAFERAAAENPPYLREGMANQSQVHRPKKLGTMQDL